MNSVPRRRVRGRGASHVRRRSFSAAGPMSATPAAGKRRWPGSTTRAARIFRSGRRSWTSRPAVQPFSVGVRSIRARWESCSCTAGLHCAGCATSVSSAAFTTRGARPTRRAWSGRRLLKTATSTSITPENRPGCVLHEAAVTPVWRQGCVAAAPEGGPAAAVPCGGRTTRGAERPVAASRGRAGSGAGCGGE